MRLSERGRSIIKQLEGLSLEAYPDTKKGWSIGYGHFGAQPGQVITLSEAERLFDIDIQKYEQAVAAATPHTTQQEFDAFTILAYNIGTAGFAGSTAARLHNAGDVQGAADAFRMWRLSDGAINPVLVARRERERDIYLNGNYVWSGQTVPLPLPLGLSSQSWPPVAYGLAAALTTWLLLPKLLSRVPGARQALGL